MSKRGDLAKYAFKFKNHQEALEQEILLQLSKSPEQRMKDFAELQKRVFGENSVDIRESGVARILRREKDAS